RELVLAEGEEEVALILGHVLAAEEAVDAVMGLDAGVVAGGELGAQRTGPAQQEVELHVAVAGHAGDRRAPLQVVAHEGLDHLLLEELLHAGDVEGDVQGLGDPARIVDVVRAAAAPALGLALVGPDPEGHPDDLMPLLLQERGSSRGVHPSAHGDDDAHGPPLPQLGASRTPATQRGAPSANLPSSAVSPASVLSEGSSST